MDTHACTCKYFRGGRETVEAISFGGGSEGGAKGRGGAGRCKREWHALAVAASASWAVRLRASTSAAVCIHACASAGQQGGGTLDRHGRSHPVAASHLVRCEALARATHCLVGQTVRLAKVRRQIRLLAEAALGCAHLWRHRLPLVPLRNQWRGEEGGDGLGGEVVAILPLLPLFVVLHVVVVVAAAISVPTAAATSAAATTAAVSATTAARAPRTVVDGRAQRGLVGVGWLLRAQPQVADWADIQVVHIAQPAAIPFGEPLKERGVRRAAPLAAPAAHPRFRVPYREEGALAKLAHDLFAQPVVKGRAEVWRADCRGRDSNGRAPQPASAPHMRAERAGATGEASQGACPPIY